MRSFAVYSVACLELVWWKDPKERDLRAYVSKNALGKKPYWQKRLETGIVLSRKAPRLFNRQYGDYSVV